MSILLTKYVFPPVFVDNARKFVGQFGVTKSGPVDEYHFLYNYTLLDNPPELSALECIGPLELTIIEPIVLAFTGSCKVFINGQLLQGAVGLFEPGSLLDIHPLQDGFRFYIGCYSGFTADAVFHSNNAVPREGFGPTPQLNTVIHPHQTISKTDSNLQNVLNKGTFKPHFLNFLLSVSPNVTTDSTEGYCSKQPKGLPGGQQDQVWIPFIKNFQYEVFTFAQRYRFLNEVFTITPESNRMGYRLEQHAGLSHEIVLENSQVTILGGLQITPSGQTIVLMNDKQTVGGYPIMGTVTQLGRARLGQLSAGRQIRFVAQDIYSAHAQQLLLRARIEHLCATEV